MKRILALSHWYAFAEPPQNEQKSVRVEPRMPTRLVALFTDLEQQLFTAISQHDEGKLRQLLSGDFQLWTPAPPGEPTDIDSWLEQMIPGYKLQSFRIRQMAAQDLNGLAAVNFVLKQRATENGKDASGDYFVVDLWKQNGGRWQLLNRYLAKVNLSRPQKNAPIRKE